MKLLVIGSGGREHALAWALAKSPKVEHVYVAPGNGGTAREPGVSNLALTDFDELIAFARQEAIGYTVVGPEAPLAAGIVDSFRRAGLAIFGPDQKAAQLEASKAFTKEICAASNALTAGYAHFTDHASAKTYVANTPAPLVIKADGLAAGKGVIIAMTDAEAAAAVDEMFDGAFGDAGAEVVIEEFMEGEEASFFILCDGENVLPIGTAQDHKRVGDGDTGPNTGGMGAYSPAPVLTDEIAQKALDEIIRPTMAEMAKRGMPYQGVLYAGLMIKDGQPRLVEYNARFGDPECQVLMMRLGAQAFDLIHAAAQGRLSEMQVNWAADHAITVVMAAKGYPAAYEKGTVIKGLDGLPEDSSNMVFHAGTTAKDGSITATGGRVLNITARGATLEEARNRAYAMVDQIDWPEGFNRSDIGWRALG